MVAVLAALLSLSTLAYYGVHGRVCQEPVAWVALEKERPWADDPHAVFAFDPAPRWFPGMGEPLPPRTPAEIPTADRGVTLHLSGIEGEGGLVLCLTLSTENRVVYREVEHRVSNEIPFLFGFIISGEPVRIARPTQGAWSGGRTLVKVVEPGESRTWRIPVDGASIDRVVGRSVGRVSIVAVFSERQPRAAALAAEWSKTDIDVLPSTMEGTLARSETLVRSNELLLRRRGYGWGVE